MRNYLILRPAQRELGGNIFSEARTASLRISGVKLQSARCSSNAILRNEDRLQFTQEEGSRKDPHKIFGNTRFVARRRRTGKVI